ncbi:hypothetical protein [Flavobacterium sp.]|uniref:hypothetical protein n=1 Tax=Flavobacterium sp. TaxID=239 RepID=UPI003F6A184B
MTRKDFIIFSLDKRLKPSLYLIVLTYSIYFFTEVALVKNGNERNLFLTLICVASFVLFLGIVHLILNYLKSKMTKKFITFFKITSNIIEITSGIALIGLAIYFLTENKIVEFIVISIMILISSYSRKKNKN